MPRGRALGPGVLFKRGRQWTLRFTDERGRQRIQALSTERRAAERIRADIISKRDLAAAGLGSVEGQSTRLDELVELYLEDLRARVTSGHFRNVEGRLRRTLPELGVDRVRDLKPGVATSVRARRVALGASNRTANLVVTTLQAMLRWAEQTGLIAENPLRHVKRLPETAEHQRYRRRSMSEDEIAQFLDAAQADDERAGLHWRMVGGGLHDHRKRSVRVPQVPLWVALLETGARWNELRLVRWADVSLRERLVTLRAESTKSRKQRVLPISEGLVAWLRALRVHHQRVFGRLQNKDAHVFLSPEGSPWGHPTTNPMRIFDRILVAAGIDKLNASGEKLDIHAIRHTCASRMARAGVPLVKAQRILGHADPKLTARVYSHVDAEDLRDAVTAVPQLDRAERQCGAAR